MLSWLPLDWVTVVIAAITAGYIYLTWHYEHWKKKGIQYEKPSLFFGNYKDVFTFKKVVGTLMHEIYNRAGDLPYIGLFRFRKPALLIRDPDIIKTILVKDFQSFDVNAFRVNEELDPMFAKSPFFSYGPRWKVVRSLLSPNFTNSKLRPLFPLIDKASQDFSQYLEKQGPKSRPDGIEAKELCCNFTTQVVSSCAFGIETKCLEDGESEFRKMNKRILNPDFFSNLKFIINIFFPSLQSLLKVRLLPTDVANFYRSLVKDVISYREKNNETRSDFLQLLMEVKDKAEATMKANTVEQTVYTQEDITAHAFTFITEGFETSSITMSFMLYHLAMSVDVQDKLRQEIQEAMEKNEGMLTFDLVNSLPYLNMVFCESLRMHPPLMAMEKYCTKSTKLPKKDGGYLQVDPGTLIIIPVHALHYDPKYFPDPEKFDPERFSDERKGSIPNYTYLPFGEGPRICIGMRFAQAQVKTGVARTILNYDVRPTARTPRKIVQNINYFLAAAEGGLRLDFIKRKL